MFPITLTIHNPAQLNAVLAALAGAGTLLPEAPAPIAAPTTNDAALTTKEAPKPGKSTSAATSAATAPSPRTASEEVDGAAEKSTSQPAPQNDTAQAAAASSADEPIPYERVGKAITDMVKANRQKAVDTLAAFGVKKGPELKPEQYAAFLAQLGA